MFARFIPLVAYPNGYPKLSNRNTGWNRALYSLARFAIAEALSLSILKKGDVLVPALCCEILSEAVYSSGNTPIYYDISADLEIGPKEIFPHLTRKTVAIIAIAYFGFETVSISKLKDLLDDDFYFLIDSAHSVPLRNQDFEFDRIYSFRKSLGLPDGACWISSNLPIELKVRNPVNPTAHQMEELRLLSLIAENWGTSNLNKVMKILDRRNSLRSQRGFNWSQAAPSHRAFEAWQKADFEEIAHERRKHAYQYAEMLKNFRNVRPAFTKVPKNCSPLAFPIWVEDADQFSQKIWEHGIEVARWWPNLNKNIDSNSFPNSFRVSRSLIQLPVHHNLRESDIDHVIESIYSIFN